MTSEPEAWKLSIACSASSVAALELRIEAFGDALDAPPTIVSTELSATDWQVDAYFTTRPDLPGDLAAHPLEPVWPDDWVRKSQEGLKPIRAGRFHVYSQATAASLPAGKIGLRIEAGPAFGTGQHATTAGCLVALDRLARRHRFCNALDLGTGSAILAMAIARRFGATVIGSDIHDESIVFARGLLRANRFEQGPSRRPRTIETLIASGLAHRRLRARAPYDLIAANILAGPLIALAPAVSRALAPGGSLVLAGLLASQEQAVRETYRAHGLIKAFRLPHPEWPVVVMRRRSA